MGTNTRVTKKRAMCADGPWKGEHLYLTGGSLGSQHLSTAFFEHKGERGRYIEDPTNGFLFWEKDHGGKIPF